MIRVAVTGATGKMGREVVKLCLEDSSLQLVGAVAKTNIGEEITEGVVITSDLTDLLARQQVDVVVDFTDPVSVMHIAQTCIANQIPLVVGTTGLTAEERNQLQKQCMENEVGMIIAPNFSIGALLMMRFAKSAAKYFKDVEIIEYHGTHKKDAPSGTSLQTAEWIQESRGEHVQGHSKEKEVLPGARGGAYEGFRIHSVRLPGVFAEQEVIFAKAGERVTIRHDSFDRAAYMPGVKLAIEKVRQVKGMLYGMEHLIEEE